MTFAVVRLVAGLTLSLFATLLTADAQQPGKVWRIGVLLTLPRPVPASSHPYNTFLQELRNLGYIEGQNITIAWHHTEGNPERRRREAATLAEWKPDVVLTSTHSEAVAIHEVNASVPVVVGAGGDLVAQGVVDSLARPGGNVTGLQILLAEVAPKRLEILKELMPRLQRVALLYETPRTAGSARYLPQLLADLDTAAKSLSVRIWRFEVTSGDDTDRAFTDMKRCCQAVIVIVGPLITAHRPRIIQLAARHSLPAMYDVRTWVEAGGLVSYGANLSLLFRRAAQFVDRILKGAKPADLPVEQPTEFELVINMKTAKALGLTIPPSLLQRVDRVIE
jgi:putative ABC transport system substrate-binding protein